MMMMIIITIMEHECEREQSRQGISGRREGERRRYLGVKRTYIRMKTA
jgi:hypothetical protein